MHYVIGSQKDSGSYFVDKCTWSDRGETFCSVLCTPDAYRIVLVAPCEAVNHLGLSHNWRYPNEDIFYCCMCTVLSDHKKTVEVTSLSSARGPIRAKMSEVFCTLPDVHRIVFAA